MVTLFAEDVVWTVASQSLLARTFTGKAGVFGKFFAGLGECSGGSLSIEIETVVANDQTVVDHTEAANVCRKVLETKLLLIR